MNNSIYALIASSVINIIMLLILLYLIDNSTILSYKKTKAYNIAIILTIILIIAEIATSTFDLLGAEFRVPNIIANIVGFSLTACIPVVLAVVFDESLYRKVKLICVPILLNFLLIIISSWTGWVFFVTANNQYMRGPLFSVYIITCVYGLSLLMVSNHHQFLQQERTERVFLLMLYALVFIGTAVQIVFPFIHASLHCVTLGLVMYYLFQREMQFKYDAVTRLLTRQVFKTKLENLRDTDRSGIILLDLDEFKKINDTYGHAKGDICLNAVASIIENSFKEIGQCYRIGGDEFCVLAQNVSDDAIHGCIKLMLQEIKQARKSDPTIPTVSYGYSIYSKNQKKDISLSLHEADENMYSYKKNRRPNL